MSGDISESICSNGSFKCNDCEFVSDSQGGLGVHRVKKHKADGSENIHSVSVVCEYPQGKSFYCCICDNIIKSWPNFKRHYKNIHPKIQLNISALCTLCNRAFSELKGVGVHMKREHDISSSSSIHPSSPSPIMSTANFADSQPSIDSCESELTSSVSSSSSSRAKSKRRNRRVKLSPINHSPSHSPTLTSTAIPSTNPPSFPSPPISQIPSTNEPVLVSMVALNGCTDVQSDSPSSHSLPPPKPFDPMVALIGCTDDDIIPIIPNFPPDPEVVINPLVTFTGCTDGATVSHNPGPFPTPSPPVEIIPDPVIRDLSPDDDDDPFDISLHPFLPLVPHLNSHSLADPFPLYLPLRHLIP